MEKHMSDEQLNTYRAENEKLKKEIKEKDILISTFRKKSTEVLYYIQRWALNE